MPTKTNRGWEKFKSKYILMEGPYPYLNGNWDNLPDSARVLEIDNLIQKSVNETLEKVEKKIIDCRVPPFGELSEVKLRQEIKKLKLK